MNNDDDKKQTPPPPPPPPPVQWPENDMIKENDASKHDYLRRDGRKDNKN